MANKRKPLDTNTVPATFQSVTRPQGTPVNPQTSNPADQQTGTPNSRYPTISYRINPDIVMRLRVWSVTQRRPIGEVAEEAIREYLERVGG